MMASAASLAARGGARTRQILQRIRTRQILQRIRTRQILRLGGYGVLVGALVVVRLHSGSQLWLDEALSVNIARLPVPDLLEALRHDGSPPLYYLLLHVWIAVFGTGNDAVRALSVVCSLLALPLAYLVGRRLGGRSAGAAVVLLLAGCPFAIRYATETRMYALVMLLTLVGILLVIRALDAPTMPRLGAVALVTGLLSLTHYWTLFLLAVTELVLLVGALRTLRARGALRAGALPAGALRARDAGVSGPLPRVALAIPCGAVLFLPWLPSFAFQSAHTGTPWAGRGDVRDTVSTVRLWAGPGTLGLVLALLLTALALSALRHRPGRLLLLTGMGALLLGLATSGALGEGYALRYSAPALIPALVATGLGTAGLGAGAWRGRLGGVAVGAAGLLGLGVALFSPLLADRTQAGVTAAALRAHLRPGDLVLYCPDQLGPAVDRLLPAGTDDVVYPTLGTAQRVDWVDYATRNAAASPSAVAAAVSARTSGAVWLVRADGYRTFGSQCADVDADLAALRGGRTVLQQPGQDGEVEWLVGYPAVTGSASP